MVLDQLWDNSEMIGGKMCLISEDNFYTLSICSVIISSIKAVLLLSGNEEILFFFIYVKIFCPFPSSRRDYILFESFIFFK